MVVLIRIAKVPCNSAKIITPTLSMNLTVLNKLWQPAELKKSHCSHLHRGSETWMLHLNFTLPLAGQRTDSFTGYFIPEELHFIVHFKLFFCKGSSEEGGDGTLVRAEKHWQLLKTGREKKPIYNRTALILPLDREGRSRPQGEQSLVLLIIWRAGK